MNNGFWKTADWSFLGRVAVALAAGWNSLVLESNGVNYFTILIAFLALCAWLGRWRSRNSDGSLVARPDENPAPPLKKCPHCGSEL